MPDEVVTMATVDNKWWASTPHTTFLTGEQQAYLLFALMVLFVIGFGLYFYWNDKQEQ